MYSGLSVNKSCLPFFDRVSLWRALTAVNRQCLLVFNLWSPLELFPVRCFLGSIVQHTILVHTSNFSGSFVWWLSSIQLKREERISGMERSEGKTKPRTGNAALRVRIFFFTEYEVLQYGFWGHLFSSSGKKFLLWIHNRFVDLKNTEFYPMAKVKLYCKFCSK